MILFLQKYLAERYYRARNSGVLFGEIETLHEVRTAVNNVNQSMPMDLYVKEIVRLTNSIC